MRRAQSTALLLFVMACGNDASDESTAGPATSSDALYSKSGTVWMAAANSTTTSLTTCWEVPLAYFNSTATEREWVRTKIASTWEAAANIRFTGWALCAGNEQVRIRVNDDASDPHTNGAGFQYGELVLKFFFNQWPTCTSTRRNCIETIAVHEFGHAIGFAHEQDRWDFTTCANGSVGLRNRIADTTIGAFDPTSIMAYCPEGAWDWDGLLSAGDQAGVRTVYGASPTDNALPARAATTGYAMRSQGIDFQGGGYLSVDPATNVPFAKYGFVYHDGIRTVLTFRSHPTPGTGPLTYGQRYTIEVSPANRALCSDGLGNLIVKPLPGDAWCVWTLRRVGGSASLGGSIVDINDPFELVDQGGRLGVFQGTTLSAFRLNGPYATAQIQSFNPPKLATGHSIVYSQVNIESFCLSKGYVTGVKRASVCSNPNQGYATWLANPGLWTAFSSPNSCAKQILTQLDCGR